jgi:hypothetical protein
MQVFSLVRLLTPTLRPEAAKIHLATWNGREDPLDVYLAGNFNEWQRWQSRRNFSRDYVISLIALPESNQWLFAGLHMSGAERWIEEQNAHFYDLKEVPEVAELNGRLVVHFQRPGRQSYLNAESWAQDLTVIELRAQRLRLAEFPGYRNVHLSYLQLTTVVREAMPAWRAALSSVAGVYLISDALSGKLYVGSACGEGGIWQRWTDYANSGHGGNRDLRALADGDPSRVEHFRFSVLEITDLHTGESDVLQRESHWKLVLLSRQHGLNAN